MCLESFDALAAAAQACRRCPAMEGRRRVLSRANGPETARVMFIAEAPGRRGGDVTGVPLSRDASGRRFTRLLGIAGLRREEVFITNAALCNPRSPDGKNRPPTRAEIAACRPWLVAQINVVAPAVIVTLGATALRSLAALSPHAYTLREHVGRPLPWAGRLLVPLYHPSPRAGLSRPYARQDEDFRALGDFLRANSPKLQHFTERAAPVSSRCSYPHQNEIPGQHHLTRPSRYGRHGPGAIRGDAEGYGEADTQAHRCL